jgi:ribosome biogenesis protein NSA1
VDLRQPVWIKDLVFLSNDGCKLAVGTAYHQLRLYDIKKKRRPIRQLRIGDEYPIRSLAINSQYT